MDWITSIGVDIGTSTSEIIISRLEVESSIGESLMPIVNIGKKEVLYQSPIYFTPFLSKNIIDFDSIKEYVQKALKESQIDKAEINTGAVIITGETARKENAVLVTEKLSEYLGEFVVATAGPKLESLLAGYGSLAWKISKKNNLRIVNLDIGGGTTNTVYFDSGDEKQTLALDIGGRLVKFDSGGYITYISERIKHILDEKKITLKIGEKADLSNLRELCEMLSQCLLESIGFSELTDMTRKLYITDILTPIKCDAISFSGGVAEHIENSGKEKDYFKYGDIGILLGEEIAKKFQPFQNYIIESKEKIRATVIGAGSHSLSVSGSTIGILSNSLPIKNVPIVKLEEDELDLIYENNKEKMKKYMDDLVAIGIKGQKSPSYNEIVKLAEGIISLFENRKSPIIVLTEEDIAKALGQIIKIKVKGKKEIICLDKIALEQGDYIDIGIPLGSAVPVVIKTLIYQS